MKFQKVPGSAAAGTAGSLELMIAAKGGVAVDARLFVMAAEKSVVGRFVKDLAENRQAETKSLHQTISKKSKSDNHRGHGGAQRKPGIHRLFFGSAIQQTRSSRSHTGSSRARRVITKGTSLVSAILCPDRTRNHSSADSITTTATSTTRTLATTASRRSLKINRGLAPAADSCRACARKPTRGLGSNAL